MVATPPGSRRERKKADARRRILDAAIALFGERGIDAVTVDEIAAAADVGKGTIYLHYRTKEDIVVAFMVAMEEQVQRRVARVAAARTSLTAILVRFLRLQFASKEPHHHFVRVFLGEMVTCTAQFMPAMVAVQKVTDPPLMDLFVRLRQRGLIRADVPMPDLLMAFKTLHLGLTMLWAVEGPPFRATYRTLQTEMDLFCRGLETKRR